MKRSTLLLACVALVVWTGLLAPARGRSGSLRAAEPNDASDRAKVRRFRLEYGATLQELPPGKDVHVWLPVPTSNDHQQIREISRTLPAEAKEGVEAKYGNHMLYFQSRAPVL